MATAEEIRKWMEANRGASDTTIAAAMRQHKVTPDQLASAMGVDPAMVARRYAAATMFPVTPVDTAFRNSPVRTMNPATGQYSYTPSAKLTPATGTGAGWKPPSVTIRPKQLLQVQPTLSPSQQFAQERQARSMLQAASAPPKSLDVVPAQPAAQEEPPPEGFADGGEAKSLLERMASSTRAGLDKLAHLTPVGDIKDYATRTALLFYPKESEWGGGADAMRHMLFQAELANRYGELPAKVLSTIHEYGPGITQSWDERRMDLENDARGREIGASEADQDARLRAIVDLIDAGKASKWDRQAAPYQDGGSVEAPQTKSRSLLDRLQRFTALDQPQDMSLGETAVDIAAGFLPGVGTAQSARDFERARRADDTLGMVLGAAGMVPVAGGAVRAARKAASVAEEVPGTARQLLNNTLPVTERPEFKNWFGESKLVDESGRPKVFYHGTYNDFDTFDREWTTKVRQRSMDTVGSWFSDNPGKGGAEQYASGEGASIMPVFLKAEKIKEYPSFDDFLSDMHRAEGRDPSKQVPKGVGSAEGLRARLKAEGYDAISFPRNNWSELKAEEAELVDAVARANEEYRQESRRLRNMGLEMSFAEGKPFQAKIDRLQDALTQKRKELSKVSSEWADQTAIVVFDPTQIKSAIGNEGTFDPASPVITKAKGGEVTTEELLAQMDRVASTPNARTPANTPARSKSSDMLGRLNRGFYENVTEPVVGSLVDMTVGLGDIGQMGTKYLAERAGVETQPFTPVAPRVREEMGMTGYDPNDPMAIATQLALPVASRVRAAGAPLLASMTQKAAPGSAQELLQRLAGETAGELQVYAGSELGAQAARELAPGNLGAELLASVAGGTAVNTLQNLDPRTVGGVGPVLGMAEYTGIPRPDQPFVGRLDRFVAENIKGTATKDQILGQLRGKFRDYDILRTQQALSDLGGKDKVTAEDLLQRLGRTYDPADFKTGMQPKTAMAYESMDNPWRNMDPSTPTSSQKRHGVLTLTRAGEQGDISSQVLSPEKSRMLLSKFNSLMDWQIWPDIAPDLTPVGRRSALSMKDPEDLSQLQDSLPKTPDMEPVLSDIQSIKDELFYLRETKNALVNGFTEPSVIRPREFNERLQAINAEGGRTPQEAILEALRGSWQDGYRRFLENAVPSQYRRDFPDSIDFSGTKDDREMSLRWHTTIKPLVSDTAEKLGDDAVREVQLYINRLNARRADIEKALSPRSRRLVPGSNPEFRGQHPELSNYEPNQIGFSRYTEVTTDRGGQRLRGMYLHEMQSDLLDEIRNNGKRGEGVEELQARIDAAREEAAQARKKAEELADAASVHMARYQAYDRDQGSEGLEAIWREYEDALRQAEEARTRAYSVSRRQSNLEIAKERAESGEMPVLDEAFPGMEKNSKALQQLLMRNAVAAAVNNGDYRFVAFTSPKYSGQPQLYRMVPQNARDVAKDLGEGFRVEQLQLVGRDGPFDVTAIVWGDNDATGREGVNRVLTQGVPFAKGGEVVTDPDDVKKLLSYLNR